MGFECLEEWRSLRRGGDCVESFGRCPSGVGPSVSCGRKVSGTSRAGARVNLSLETLSSTPSLYTVTDVLSNFKAFCAAPVLRVSFVIFSSAVRSEIGFPADGGGL